MGYESKMHEICECDIPEMHDARLTHNIDETRPQNRINFNKHRSIGISFPSPGHFVYIPFAEYVWRVALARAHTQMEAVSEVRIKNVYSNAGGKWVAVR